MPLCCIIPSFISTLSIRELTNCYSFEIILAASEIRKSSLAPVLLYSHAVVIFIDHNVPLLVEARLFHGGFLYSHPSFMWMAVYDLHTLYIWYIISEVFTHIITDVDF